jgi:hypothetical protein
MVMDKKTYMDFYCKSKKEFIEKSAFEKLKEKDRKNFFRGKSK